MVNFPSSLPAGLSFSTSTGAISGTPTVTSSSTSYTVTASNSGGSATAIRPSVTIAPPSSITYSPSSLTLAKGVAMTTVTPTTSGGPVSSWSISPSLPSGLSFDVDRCHQRYTDRCFVVDVLHHGPPRTQAVAGQPPSPSRSTTSLLPPSPTAQAR